ncbi:MAG: hypothetical protein KatS3mg077_1561 [Candidatus Binatia bacterium]|nr:MAG: hypothetical protein KatS3mg077_1561 [Candidatus Binatia bacterium]
MCTASSETFATDVFSYRSGRTNSNPKNFRRGLVPPGIVSHGGFVRGRGRPRVQLHIKIVMLAATFRLPRVQAPIML